MNNSGIRVCAGIVTYNPDIKRLKKNYSHISQQVDHVVICDNGSYNLSKIERIISEKDVIITLGENKGIAFALNQLCDYAYKNGFRWIITLDQDSVCPSNMVVQLCEHCNDDTAIIAPRIIYEGNEAFSAKSDTDVESVEWVITSGSLTNTQIWNTIKGFDDLLFIDKVDTDYGIRVNNAGFKVVRDNRVMLNHELGNMNCKVLLGRTIYVTNHNPTRIYYQCRNTIYLGKKVDLPNPAIETWKIITKILLFESHKKEKIKNAFKGIQDGIRMCKQYQCVAEIKGEIK